jgi:predicted GIY-YIG superfamily endonuclease
MTLGGFFGPIPDLDSIFMYFTYILESSNEPGERYIGHTSDLRKRLEEHNSGKCRHTAKYKPWKLKLYVAFETLSQAQHFERYLKSGAGHAFANRHFWLQLQGDQ